MIAKLNSKTSLQKMELFTFFWAILIQSSEKLLIWRKFSMDIKKNSAFDDAFGSVEKKARSAWEKMLKKFH
jgi:hypothetical protein